MPFTAPRLEEPQLSEQFLLVYELLSDSFGNEIPLDLSKFEENTGKNLTLWPVQQWLQYLKDEKPRALNHLSTTQHEELFARLDAVQQTSQTIDLEQITKKVESGEVVTILGGTKNQSVLYEFSQDKDGGINFYIINIGEGSEYNEAAETAYGTQLIKTRIKPALAFKLNKEQYNKKRFGRFLSALIEARTQDIKSVNLYAICYKFNVLLGGIEVESPEKYGDYLAKKRSASAPVMASTNVLVRSVLGKRDYKTAKLDFSRWALEQFKQKLQGNWIKEARQYYAECIKVFAKRLDKAKSNLTPKIFAEHQQFITAELAELSLSASSDDMMANPQSSSVEELVITAMRTAATLSVDADSTYIPTRDRHRARNISTNPIIDFGAPKDLAVRDGEAIIAYIERVCSSPIFYVRSVKNGQDFDVIFNNILSGTSTPEQMNLTNEDDLMEYLAALAKLQNQYLHSLSSDDRYGKRHSTPESNLMTIKCMMLTIKAINLVYKNDPVKKDWLSMVNSLALFRIQMMLSSAVSGFYTHEQMATIRKIRADLEQYPHKKQWAGAEIREISRNTCNAMLSDEEKKSLSTLPKYFNDPLARIILKFSGLYDLARTFIPPVSPHDYSYSRQVDRKFVKLSSHLKLEQMVQGLFTGALTYPDIITSPASLEIVTYGWYKDNVKSLLFWIESALYQVWFEYAYGGDAYKMGRLRDIRSAEAGSMFAKDEDNPQLRTERHVYLARHNTTGSFKEQPRDFTANFGITSDSLTVMEHNRTASDHRSTRVLTEAASHESLGLVNSINYYLDNMHLLRDKSERIKMFGTVISPKYILHADFDLIARKKLLEFINSAVDYFKHIKTDGEQREISGLYVIFAVATVFSFAGDKLGLQGTLNTINALLSDPDKYSVSGSYILHQAKLKCVSALGVDGKPNYLFQGLSSYLFLLNHQESAHDTECEWDRATWKQQIKAWLSVEINQVALQQEFVNKSDLAEQFKQFIATTFLENNEVIDYKFNPFSGLVEFRFNHDGEEEVAYLNLITGEIAAPFGNKVDLPIEFSKSEDYKTFFENKKILSYKSITPQPGDSTYRKFYEIKTDEESYIVTGWIFEKGAISGHLQISKKIDRKDFILANKYQVNISGLQLNDNFEYWYSDDLEEVKIFDKTTKALCYTAKKNLLRKPDYIVNHRLSTQAGQEYSLLNPVEIGMLFSDGIIATSRAMYDHGGIQAGLIAALQQSNKHNLKAIYKLNYHPLVWEVKQSWAGALTRGAASLVSSRFAQKRQIKIELSALSITFNYDEQHDSLNTDDGWTVAKLDPRFPTNALVLAKAGESYKRILIPKCDYGPAGSVLFRSYMSANYKGHIEFKLGVADNSFASLESSDVYNYLALGFALLFDKKPVQAMQAFAKAGCAVKSKEHPLQDVMSQFTQLSQLLPRSTPLSDSMRLQALLAILNAYDTDLMQRLLPEDPKKQKTALAAVFTGDLVTLAKKALGVDDSRSPETQLLIKDLQSIYTSYVNNYRNIPAEFRLKHGDEKKLLTLFNCAGIATDLMVRRQRQLNHPHPLPLEKPLLSASTLLDVVKKVVPEYVKAEDFKRKHLSDIVTDLNLDFTQILARPKLSISSVAWAKVFGYKELKFEQLESLGILEGKEDYDLLLNYFKKLILDPTKVADKKLIEYIGQGLKQYIFNMRMGTGADGFKDNPVYYLCFLIYLRHQSPRLFDTPSHYTSRYRFSVDQPRPIHFFHDLLARSDAYFSFWGASCSATGPKRLIDQLTGNLQPKEDEVAGDTSIISLLEQEGETTDDIAELGYKVEAITSFDDPANTTDSDADSQTDAVASPSSSPSSATSHTAVNLYAQEKEKQQQRFGVFKAFWQDSHKRAAKLADLAKQQGDISKKCDKLADTYSTIRARIEADESQQLKIVSKQRQALPQDINQLLIYFIINKNNYADFCRLYNITGSQANNLRRLLIQYGNFILKSRRIEKIQEHAAGSNPDLQQLHKLFTEKVGASNPVELAFQFGREGIDYWSLQRGALAALQRSTGSNVLKQLIMGSGKTKAISPTVLGYHAACDYLSIFVVPEQLLGINQKDLKAILQEKFQGDLYVLNFERNECTRSDYTRYTYEMLLNTKANNGVVIAAPKTLLSIKLKYYEYCLNSDSLTEDDVKAKDYLRRVLKLIHDDGKMVIDEADTVLKITNPLIYRLESKNPNAELSKLFVELYSELCKHTFNLHNQSIDMFDLISSKDTHSLSEDEIKAYLKAFCKQVVAQRIIRKLNLTTKVDLSVLEHNIVRYLLDPGFSINDLTKDLPSEAQQKILKIKDYLAFYRGVLTKILPVTLRRKHNEDYGVDEKSDIAIPYKGPNKPAYGHGFGTIEESMAYTMQQIFLVGFSKKLLDALIVDFYNKALKEFESNLASTLLETPSAIAFKKLTGKDISALFDSEDKRVAFLGDINSDLKQKKTLAKIVWYAMEHYVLPKLEYDTSALSAYSHDLVTMVQPANVQGFTGTPWNHKTYPELKFKHSGENLLTDATAEALIKCELNKVVVVPHAEDCSLGQMITTYLDQPDTQAIIDVGAKLRQYSNREVAQAILGSGKLSPEIECVLYFSGDTLYALKKGQDDPIQLAGTSWDVISKQAELGITDPRKVFAYYDKTHTVGVDFKFAPKARAKVLVNNHSCLYELLQGGLRMRGLEAGQLLDLVIDEKLKTFIAPNAASDAQITTEQLLEFTRDNQRKKLIAEQIMSVRKHMVTEATNYILSKSAFGDDVDESQIGKMLELTNWVLIKNSDQLFEKFGSAELSVRVPQVLEELYQDITGKLEVILSKHKKSPEFKACIDRIAQIKDSVTKDLEDEVVVTSKQQMDTQVQVAKEVKIEVQVQQELQLELEQVTIKAHPKKPLDPAWIKTFTSANAGELLKTVYPHVVQLDAVTYKKYGFDSNLFLSRDFAHSFRESYLEHSIFYRGAKVPTYVLVKRLATGAPMATIVSAEEADFFIKNNKSPDCDLTDVHLQNYKGEVLAGSPPVGWDDSVENIRIMEQVQYFRGDLPGLGRLVASDQISWLSQDAVKKLKVLKEIMTYRKADSANLQWVIDKVTLKLQEQPAEGSIQSIYRAHKPQNFLAALGRISNWYTYYSVTSFNLYYLQKLHYLQVKALYIIIDTIRKLVMKYIELCKKIFGEGSVHANLSIVGGIVGGLLGAAISLIYIPYGIVAKFVALGSAYIIATYNLVIPKLILFILKFAVTNIIFSTICAYAIVYIKQLGVFIYDNFINKDNKYGDSNHLVYTNSAATTIEIKDPFAGEVAIAASAIKETAIQRKPNPKPLRVLRPQEYSSVLRVFSFRDVMSETKKDDDSSRPDARHSGAAKASA